jgi:small subunit ribosomal protein S5
VVNEKATTYSSDSQRKPRSFGNRRDQAPSEPKEFEEVVINIDRVSRVVKGGRRFRFKALVVVGDGKNRVGIGVSKGADVQAAIAKATDVAKKHIINIAIDNETIPHDVEIRFSGAQILLKPASPGTGIIAGGAVRTIIGVTGIKNLLTKSLGSTNKVNIAYATIEALKSVVPRSEWLNASPKKIKEDK